MVFTLQTFTLFHVLVSLVGIISGLVVAGGLAEPPFAMAQLLVLASFVWLGVAANAGARSAVGAR